MEGHSDSLEQQDAVLSFLGECILEASTTNNQQEEDGVAVCFDALAEIAPGFFGTLASSRHLGDNWVLQQADMKKLLRFMEIYYQMKLHKTTHLIAEIDVAAIAKRHDPHEIFTMLKLVAVAAVLCSRKTTYIGRMMDRLPTDVRSKLKLVLEETMVSLVDVEVTTSGPNEQKETTEPSESCTSTTTVDGEAVSLVIDDVKQVTATIPIDTPSPYKQYLQESQEHELRIRQLVATLEERDRSLEKMTIENAKLKNQLQEHSIKIEALTTENGKLADELDIVQPQVRQLYRAQMETSAYKKHIEDISYEKAQQLSLSGLVRDLSLSIPISDEEMDQFPCFEDSDEASTNPFFSSDLSVNEDNAVIPDDVDDAASLDQLKCQMELLLESHRLMESENESLLRENEKLSAYVKRAVTRYQDQYLSAKHSLSKSQQQIKEQQQLIGMLQRRVERQPSITLSSKRKKNKSLFVMRAKVQEYGLGAY